MNKYAGQIYIKQIQNKYAIYMTKLGNLIPRIKSIDSSLIK